MHAFSKSQHEDSSLGMVMEQVDQETGSRMNEEGHINLEELDPDDIYGEEEEDDEEDDYYDVGGEGHPKKKSGPSPNDNHPNHTSLTSGSARKSSFALKGRKLSTAKDKFRLLSNPLASIPRIKMMIQRFMISHNIRKLSDVAPELAEDGSLQNKAQYFKVVRMYKVESEKTKILQQKLRDIKEEMASDKEVFRSMHNEVNQLNRKIADLSMELQRARKLCKHGGCPLCKKEEEERKQDLDMSDAIDEVFDDDSEEESENSESEVDETSPSKRKKMNNRRSKKGASVTQAQNVSLGRRNAIDRKVNPAPTIISKLKQKKMSKFKNFMPLKLVLRQINQLYEDRIKFSKESATAKEEELSCFIYNLYLNNFGFKKIAEQKFIILILSIKKYLHIVRINLFARFLGLLEINANYNVDELNRYLEGVEFLSSNNLGMTIFNADGDCRHYTPYVRFLEYLKNFSENKMGFEEYLEFKKEFEPMKEDDPKHINRSGIIDIDLFMMKVLSKYLLICNRTKQFVVNAFKAADLDANKKCNLTEFILLYKYIESEKFDLGFVKDLFNDYADILDEEEKNLSFDRFTVICVDYSLFTDYQQDKFLMIVRREQLLEKLEEYRSNWLQIYANTEEKLNSLKKIDQKEIEKWEEILLVLGQRINSPTPENLSEIKPLLIAAMIMEAEINDLVDSEIEKKPVY